jgi:hypothetical protein
MWRFVLGNSQRGMNCWLQGRRNERTYRLLWHSIPLALVALIISLCSGRELHAHDMRYAIDPSSNGLYARLLTVFKAREPLSMGRGVPLPAVAGHDDNLLPMDGRDTLWVRDQHIIAQRTTPEQSTVHRENPQENSTAHRPLLQEIAILNKEMANTTRRLAQATRANRQVADKIARLHSLVARDKRLKSAHQALIKAVIDLEHRAELLEIEHSALRDHIRGNWMLVTSIVLVSGLLLGLFATTRPRTH